jgi:hypothetical protein
MENRRSVEGAIDFNHVNVFSQEKKSMKSNALPVRVDDSFPVFVAPTCSSYIVLHVLPILINMSPISQSDHLLVPFITVLKLFPDLKVKKDLLVGLNLIII